MKATALTTTLLAALFTQAGAFSLDLTNYSQAGTPVSQAAPMILPVAGYGNVSFTMLPGELGVVGTTYTDDSIEIAPGETIVVDFLGAPVEQVVFDFVGVSTGETASPNDVTPNQSTVMLLGFTPAANGAGMEEVRFVLVPEPSAAALGLLGLIGLLRRRR